MNGILGRIQNILEAEANYKKGDDPLDPKTSINPVDTPLEKLENIAHTVKNAISGMTYSLNDADVVQDLSTLRPADHLYVWRPGYTHHGLYLGNGQVIHYADFVVKVNRLDEFRKRNFLDPTAVLDPSLPLCQVRRFSDIESPKYYSDDEIIHRAFSRLGETEYDLITNNCEHFVRWCRSGA